MHHEKTLDAPKSDIEIAQRCELLHIADIAAKLGLGPEDLHLFGEHKAKIKMSRVRELLDSGKEDAPLILVSGMTPTEAGEGKTTCCIGLTQGLERLGHRSCVTLREPSLGPVFGRKGGATGGGYSQVLPMEDINLHFTGDLHAIGAANNLIAALLDNALHFKSAPGVRPESVMWRRAMDINDRTLRNLVGGRGDARTGFDITAASSIMAVFCLALSYEQLKEKIGDMVLAFTEDGRPYTARDLGVVGPAATLLKQALEPNLVQTNEHGPSFVHGGPFANIAQGTCSVLSMRLAQKLSDYVVTEAGFGFDLGGEKFLDLVAPKAGFWPSSVVVVATVRSLKMHGGTPIEKLSAVDPEAVWRGAENLEKHIENVRKFGIEPVIAINRFYTDSQAELDAVAAICKRAGVASAVVDGRNSGGSGCVEFAQKVVENVEVNRGKGQPLYDSGAPVEEKIATVATEIYGADGVEYSEQALEDLKLIYGQGYDRLPICIAKTHTSISDKEKLLGRPGGFMLDVRTIKISAGPGFLVPMTGKIMRMPGLPRRPAAHHIDIADDGTISGLS